jgi:electron transfer flavoprotein alpha subunit
MGGSGMSKDIFVIVEQRNGNIQKVGLELIGEAKRLAADLKQKVVAVLMGSKIENKASTLFHYGADKVILIDDLMLDEYVTEPYAKALTTAIKEYDPEIVLFGASAIGRDLAPRVASRIHTGLTADCTSFAIDPESKLLYMTRPAFGGKIMATITCSEYRPQMATVRPGVMDMAEPNKNKTGELIKLDVKFTPEDMTVEILEIAKDNKKIVDITEAKIVVSGGRGVGGPDGYAPLRELAEVLGGEIASSRVGVNNGWIEDCRLVGQTGKTVRPQLYIACGISGAIQHVAGMESSDFILAINTDVDAPIMDTADLGIVGDIKVIIPKLTEAIRKHKAQTIAE